jgi:hypothetical protein
MCESRVLGRRVSHILTRQDYERVSFVLFNKVQLVFVFVSSRAARPVVSSRFHPVPNAPVRNQVLAGQQM